MSLGLIHTLIIAVVLTSTPGTGPVLLEACSQGSRISGECANISSTVDGQSVTLGATQSTPGSPGGATSTPLAPPQTGPRLPWSPPPVRNPVLGSAQCSVIIAGSCRGQSPPKNPPQASAPAVVRPIPPGSLSDLAAFSPSSPAIVVEPGAWSLPRVMTNIYASAQEHSQAGELLGWPIEVRFSPRGYRWNYGDGSSANHSEPGGSWGARQFSPTSTGHIYRAPGTYTITLQVDYAVSYRFDTGAFVPVAGQVSASAGSTSVTVLRVTPVLVDRGCDASTLVEGRCG